MAARSEDLLADHFDRSVSSSAKPVRWWPQRYRLTPIMRLASTDASVAAVAERLKVSEVAALERRHFTVVQLSHANALILWLRFAIAVANEQDRHHVRCVEWFDAAPRPLLMPAPILTEVCYLLERERGAAVDAAFLRSVRDEAFTLVSLTHADLDRMADLVETYASMPPGAADASVVAIAERLKLTEVATRDRRHFTVVRPNHVQALTLLP